MKINIEKLVKDAEKEVYLEYLDPDQNPLSWLFLNRFTHALAQNLDELLSEQEKRIEKLEKELHALCVVLNSLLVKK